MDEFFLPQTRLIFWVIPFALINVALGMETGRGIKRKL